RLGQVFLGLLINAAEAMADGDADANVIRIRTLLDDPLAGEAGQGDGRISGEFPAPRVVIEIADTGSGIAPENRDRLFDPFFTTKPFGESRGLGLYLCHGIITAIGGEISVESEP